MHVYRVVYDELGLVPKGSARVENGINTDRSDTEVGLADKDHTSIVGGMRKQPIEATGEGTDEYISLSRNLIDFASKGKRKEKLQWPQVITRVAQIFSVSENRATDMVMRVEGNEMLEELHANDTSDDRVASIIKEAMRGKD